MRRLAAFAALLAFANLSFVQAGASCAVPGNPSSAEQVVVAGHLGHDMPAPSHHDSLEEAPDGDATNPACLMMGPCALVIDVGRMVVLASDYPDEDGVLRGSDILPASPSASPDIPPPRA